ncbi:MAG TPA: AAA family ATPase [Leptospiraceae bacterium]|nr:AAA family ATPase [Leptospiraceae bacterium]
MEIKSQIQELLTELNKDVYEKEEVLGLALLSAIAGESIFLLGAPGVAKSLIARRLKFAFRDASSFEYLMNRFSTPDEIFGPVSISKLKDEDKYERIVKNYLPSADVVFLDEIWKAGPSIQNALLTVLNEKIYRNGDKEIKVPMKALISASNELPSSGEGLEALWDRFLLRYVVDGVLDKENFNEMISKSLKSYEDTIDARLKITANQYTGWSSLIDEVTIPENIFAIIHIIRNYIQEFNEKPNTKKENTIYVSDRRWKKIIRLLRTSAYLNGRQEVDLMDCFLIQHCIWNEPSQIDTVSQFVKDAVQKYGYKSNLETDSIKKEIEDLKTEVKEETRPIKKIEINQIKVYEIQKKEYYNLLNLKGITNYENESFIEKSIVDNLKLNQQIQAKRFKNDLSESSNVNIKKTNKKNKIILIENYQEHEIKLEEDILNKDQEYTKKPNPVIEKHWDNRIETIQSAIAKLKNQIEEYKTKDLKHIRVNLFVNPSLAEFVEKNIHETNKELEKQELDLGQIQRSYKNIEDDQVLEKL